MYGKMAGFLSGFGGRLKNGAAAFQRNERGTFAVITGVSAVAVMLCAGIAIDYTRLSMTRASVNGALDAAILAAGHELSSGAMTGAELRQYFDDFFEANLEQGFVDPATVTITGFSADAETGSVSATASADVALTFMALSGTSNVAVTETVEAVYSSSDVEIAMALDVTGSMSGAKLAALKLAANDAVDILIPEGSSGGKLRIGLIPYASSVNAGRSMARTATANRSNRCVTERGGANAYNDVSYAVQPVGADARAIRDDLCPAKALRGLTPDRYKLKADINTYRADGYTAGHIGVAWSYYMLSENWRSLWSGDAKPAPYSDDVRKIAILMTDGEFNTYYDGTRGNPFGPYEAQSSASATAICADMKAMKGANPGITIYSIAFQAPASAKATLSACASSDEHYFDAQNGAELRLAFQQIAAGIQKLRLTR